MTDTTQIGQAASPLSRVTATLAKATTPAPGRPEVAAPAASGFAEPAAKTKEATAQKQATATADDQATAAAVVKLNDYMKQENRALQFSVDDATGRTVIKVTDAETQEVIRQIPPEQVLALMESFAEGSGETGHRGLLLRTTV